MESESLTKLPDSDRTSRRTLAAVTLKADGDGADYHALARVSGYGMVDYENDKILPGAFSLPAAVGVSGWAHSSTYESVPVGKATLWDDDGDILAGVKFFETEQGEAVRHAVKELMPEWSIAFYIRRWKFEEELRLIEKADVFEVSPVYRGAHPNTATLDAKQAPDEGVAIHVEPDVITLAMTRLYSTFQSRYPLENITSHCGGK